MSTDQCVSQSLDAWAEVCWPLLNIRPVTLREYRARYRRAIQPAFGDRDMEQISRREVQAWVLRLTPTIGAQALPVLKTLYREALTYAMCEANPTIGVRKRPHATPKRDFMPWADLRHLDFGQTYNDLFRFLARHGLRWSEAMQLTADDVQDGFVHVRRSRDGLPPKGGKIRRVPYMGYWSDFPRSYAWARRRFADVTTEAIGKPLTIHSLRVTYAHSLRISGVDLEVARDLLGHSTITLTADIYGRVMPDELENARRLLRSA